jgi:glycerol-3-phosphate acyltransferase PlsX
VHETGTDPGVDQPALATTIPTKGAPAVLLDAGANASAGRRTCCSSRLGSAYAQVLGCASPRIGLLSIGEEATKGTT